MSSDVPMEPLTPGTPFTSQQTPMSQTPATPGTPATPATPGTPSTPASDHLTPSTPASGITPGTGFPTSPASIAPSGRPTSDPTAPQSDDVAEREYIWGTTVNIRKTMTTFERFFKNYTLPDSTEPLYPALLQEIYSLGLNCINIDIAALRAFDDDCAELHRHLILYPAEVIPTIDLAIHNLYLGLASKEPTTQHSTDDEHRHADRISVRFHNIDEEYVRPMRDLDPEHIDTLVGVRGMIIRSTSIIPDLRQAFFRCIKCSHEEHVDVDRGRVDEPALCVKCKGKQTFEIVHNRCVFKDKQLIKMQETPESIPEGETPHTINVYAYDDLVDIAIPGDRVLVTGVFRAIPIRSNPRQRTVLSVFRTHVDAIHFQKLEKGRLQAENELADEGEYKPRVVETDDTTAIKDAKRERLRDMSLDTDLYDKLSRSLAPSIWMMDDVKKGLLLQLFGGTTKDRKENGKFRGEINVLLCGDPGTSKSQLLSYVNKISPRGIYTSGKGSSAVGLTAYITKDPDTREPVLESGALVLSDRGICCIDEFDKMSDSTRSILHEVMEQQTVSIAKAGIICTLNARTSILASANPVESRYNPSISVVENIRLPPTLISRFDLIYLVLDKCDKASDRALAKHLVNLYSVDQSAATQDVYSLADMTDYISFAKSSIEPELSEDAGERLVALYKEMRDTGRARKTIAATPRQLTALIRLAEAHARMKLQSVVHVEDVEEAYRLVRAATLAAAVDPRTGTIDMGMLGHGAPQEAQGAVARLVDELAQKLLKKKYITKASVLAEHDSAVVTQALRILGTAVVQDKGNIARNEHEIARLRQLVATDEDEA